MFMSQTCWKRRRQHLQKKKKIREKRRQDRKARIAAGEPEPKFEKEKKEKKPKELKEVKEKKAPTVKKVKKTARKKRLEHRNLTKKQKEKLERKKAIAEGKRIKPGKVLRKKWRLRNLTRILEPALSEQFDKGRLYARISTSPGQSGTADGYILEGEELAFYLKKLAIKKKK